MNTKIQNLPGVEWSKEAALGKALEQVSEMRGCLVLWLSPGGEWSFTASGLTNAESLWLIEKMRADLMS